MNASQFFIEYLIVGAFAIVTIAFAIGETFGLRLGFGRDLSAVETASIALLLPTIGLAVDCIGKVMLWIVDTVATPLNAGAVAVIRAVRVRLFRYASLSRRLESLASFAADVRKPTVSHIQMARLGSEVVRQSEMRKSRERVSRGGFASSVTCAFIFWLGMKDGLHRQSHFLFALIAALVFCGAWYRYRRRVRLYREGVAEVYADMLAERPSFHKE